MMVTSAKTRRLWLRLSIVILMLVIGHDALMAMNSHEAAAADAHGHHQEIARECATLEGAMHSSQVQPSTHPPAAFSPARDIAPMIACVIPGFADIAPVVDTSTLRAWTQVFLN